MPFSFANFPAADTLDAIDIARHGLFHEHVCPPRPLLEMLRTKAGRCREDDDVALGDDAL
jgi:hypothetical protein